MTYTDAYYDDLPTKKKKVQKKNFERLKDDKFKERYDNFASLVTDIYKIYKEAGCDCVLENKRGNSGQSGIYFKTTQDKLISEAIRYFHGDWTVKYFYYTQNNNGELNEKIERLNYPEAIRRLKTWKEAGLVILSEKIKLDNVLAKLRKAGITKEDVDILERNNMRTLKEVI